MKFLVSVFICLIAPLLQFNGVDYAKVSEKGIEAYSETGYDQFKEITPDMKSVELIHNMSDTTIDNALDSLKKKFIGSSEKTLNLYADAKYVSNTIFSRSNLTREEFSFTYDTSTVVYNEVSVSVKGTLSAKGTFKGKNKELTVNGEVTGTYSTKNSTEDTEKNKFSVVIYPGKKVTLRIVGSCKVSNGVKKTYFLGIRTSKGAWEVIDITSTCCELIEENAK